MHWISTFALPALALLAFAAGPAAQADGVEWDAVLAEHLLNRAGFGARPAEIDAAVRLGREALVKELLEHGQERGERYFASNHGRGAAMAMASDAMGELGELDELAKRELRGRRRREDLAQLDDFSTYWIERMLGGEDPLREKMTLFWHGHFATSQKTVKNSFEMIRQNELFYGHALGSFEALLRGVARDPAMLDFLDNDTNRKSHPNENFARELMELFTLGEGNYSEDDVKEAARAFTGWTDRRSVFRVKKRQHDTGDKTVLGISGNFDGDDVIDVLLDQEACGRHLATKLLSYFEGVDPDPERAAFYGEFFAANDYDVAVFLSRLFNDPAFYRPEIVGARIAGPVEFMVGTTRRLGLRPPARLLQACATILGQRLFYPPSVKGWDEGAAWITTSSLMQRGNLAGILLGVVAIDDILAVDTDELDTAQRELDDGTPASSMDDAATDARTSGARRPERRLGGMKALKGIRLMRWQPRLNLTARLERLGATRDGELVDSLLDELLAIEIDGTTRDYLRDVLRAERKAAGIKNGGLLDEPAESEPILRRLAHLILSLPEAQLH